MAPTRTSSNRRIGIFVDGENHSIRLKEVREVVGDRFKTPRGYDNEEVAFWSSAYNNWQFPFGEVVRTHYYTSCTGDETALSSVRQELQMLGVGETVVFKKSKKGRKTKHVDVKLATDLLSACYQGHLDDVVLVAMDRDYLALVEKVKSLGVRAFLAFPGFRLLKDHWMHGREEKIRGVMGYGPGSQNYVLAFDGVLDDLDWFVFKSLSPQEMEELARKHVAPVIGETFGDHGSGPDGEAFSFYISGNAFIGGNAAAAVLKDGTVAVYKKRSPDGRIEGKKSHFSLAPLSTIEERLRCALGTPQR